MASNLWDADAGMSGRVHTRRQRRISLTLTWVGPVRVGTAVGVRGETEAAGSAAMEAQQLLVPMEPWVVEAWVAASAGWARAAEGSAQSRHMQWFRCRDRRSR